MKFNFSVLKWLLKLGMPASIAAFFLIPLYGYLNPWPPATELLQPYQGQSAILVGMGQKFSRVDGQNTANKSRVYILFPSVFSAPKTVSVIQIDNELPTVDEQRHGFLFNLSWFVISLFGTWWFWFRRGSVRRAG